MSGRGHTRNRSTTNEDDGKKFTFNSRAPPPLGHTRNRSTSSLTGQPSPSSGRRLTAASPRSPPRVGGGGSISRPAPLPSPGSKTTPPRGSVPVRSSSSKASTTRTPPKPSTKSPPKKPAPSTRGISVSTSSRPPLRKSSSFSIPPPGTSLTPTKKLAPDPLPPPSKKDKEPPTPPPDLDISDRNLDKQSLAVQQKVFTHFINLHLGKGTVTNLDRDLEDGVKLINLVEKISGKKVSGKWTQICKQRFQKLENLTLVLDFLREDGVHLVNVGVEDIIGGNKKIILALLWQTISRYQLAGGGRAAKGHSEAKNASQELLSWVQQQVQKYRIPPIENFTHCWSNGHALCALADSLKPGLLNMDKLGRPLEAVGKGMAAAEKNFDISRMMDPEDMVNSPDDLAIATYVSFFRDYAADQNRRKKSGEGQETGIGIEDEVGKDAIVEYLTEEFDLGECEIKEELLEDLLEEGKTVDGTIDLMSYLSEDGVKVEEIPNVKEAFQAARVQKMAVKKEVKVELSSGRNKVLGTKMVSMADVEKVYKDGHAGAKTASHLRTLGWEGKEFGTVEELGGAIQTVHKEYVQQKKQDKKSLQDYLATSETGLLETQEISQSDVNLLYAIEKSGGGTAALVQELQSTGKTYKNFGDLVEDAKKLSTKKRDELSKLLVSPEVQLFKGAKEDIRNLAQDVSRLVEEGEAGPATLARVEELDAMGARFEYFDDLIPAVRKAQRATKDPILNKPPPKPEKKISPADKEKLKELIDDQGLEVVGTIKGDIYEDLLMQSEGVAEAFDLCTHMADGGIQMEEAPQVKKACQTARVRRIGCHKEMRNVLDSIDSKLLGKKKITLKDMEILYNKSGTGAKTPYLLRVLVLEGRQYSNLDQLSEALQAANQKNIQESKDAKAALHQYLMSDTCQLFKKTKERDIKQSDINKLFALEKTGPGTIALVSELVSQLEAMDTFLQLLEKAKTLSKKRRKELLHYVKNDFKLIDAKEKSEITERDVDRLREQGTAGPATFARLKELEEQKKKVAKLDDLIIPVQKAQRGLVQGASFLKASFEDLEQLLDFFASPECKLLNAAQTIDEKDLHDLWRICPTTGTTLDYCKYLEDQGVVFDHVVKLTSAVKNIRNTVCEMHVLLTNKSPSAILPQTVKITIRDTDSLYLSSSSNPLEMLKQFTNEKRKFTSMDHLRHTMISIEKKKGAESLREFFAQPDVKLYDRARELSEDQFYSLVKEGGNVDTTILHLRILNQKRLKFTSHDQLAKAIRAARQEVKKHYEEIKKVIVDKKMIFYDSSSVPGSSEVEYDDYEKKKKKAAPRGPQPYTYNMIGTNDIEQMWLETAGSDIIKYLGILSSNGRKFRSWNELIQAIKEVQKREPGK